MGSMVPLVLHSVQPEQLYVVTSFMGNFRLILDAGDTMMSKTILVIMGFQLRKTHIFI